MPNYRLHDDFQKDNTMDQVLCKKHLDAMLNNHSEAFREQFKKHCTVTECNHPCEDCSQYAYEAQISEG